MHTDIHCHNLSKLQLHKWTLQNNANSKSYFSPDKEKTLYWDDKTVNIEWPIKPSVISEKDKIGELLKNITPVII